MRRILIFSFLMALTACIYPYTQEIPEQDEDNQTIVVSGDILIGEQTTIVLNAVSPLGTPYSATKQNKVNVEVITIDCENAHRSLFGERTTKGTYIFNTKDLPADDSYRLRFSLGKDKYETPYMKALPAPEISSLDYVTDDTNLYLRIGLDGGADLTDFRWDFTENWEYHAYFVPDLMYVPNTGTENPSLIYREPTENEDYYYCWNSADGKEPVTASTSGQSENRIKDMVFRSIPRSDNRLSVLYSILVTARGLSPEGRAYLDYLNSTSNITGDLFTPIPSNMNGNLRCVTDSSRIAVGFVNVTRRTSKRIFVSYESIFLNPVIPEYYLYYPEYDEEEHSYHFEDLYKSGDAPVYCSSSDGPPMPTKTNVQWAPRWCSDCRASGGTKKKPEWWPNNHK